MENKYLHHNISDSIPGNSSDNQLSIYVQVAHQWDLRLISRGNSNLHRGQAGSVTLNLFITALITRHEYVLLAIMD